jgi:hypothetical protein
MDDTDVWLLAHELFEACDGFDMKAIFQEGVTLIEKVADVFKTAKRERDRGSLRWWQDLMADQYHLTPAHNTIDKVFDFYGIARQGNRPDVLVRNKPSWTAQHDVITMVARILTNSGYSHLGSKLLEAHFCHMYREFYDELKA